MSETDRPSRTQRKKAVEALQALGEALLSLPDDRLSTLDLPERLRDALVAARSMTTHGARRRQLQYIGRLMRAVDPEPIRAALQNWRAGHDAQSALHRRTEVWRERLLADPRALDAFLAAHPDADAVQWRTRIDDAQRGRASGRPQAYRELYRALRALLEQT